MVPIAQIGLMVCSKLVCLVRRSNGTAGDDHPYRRTVLAFEREAVFVGGRSDLLRALPGLVALVHFEGVHDDEEDGVEHVGVGEWRVRYGLHRVSLLHAHREEGYARIVTSPCAVLP